MYTMKMNVDEHEAILHYNDYAVALEEFKDCVVEVFGKTNEHDNYIMKITKDYAIFIVDCKKVSMKIELYKGDE